MREKPDTRHQCRYCAFCVVTIDDIPVCEHDKVQNPENADNIPYPFKRPNRCPYWLFNEIAADFFGDDRKVYRPRKPSPYKQPRLFDMPTDKHKAKQKTR